MGLYLQDIIMEPSSYKIGMTPSELRCYEMGGAYGILEISGACINLHPNKWVGLRLQSLACIPRNGWATSPYCIPRNGWGCISISSAPASQEMGGVIRLHILSIFRNVGSIFPILCFLSLQSLTNSVW